MRLVLVGPVHPYRGGVAHYTMMLHRALAGIGHEVLLVSFARQYPSWLFPGVDDRDPSAEPFSDTNANYWLDSLNPLTWLRAAARIRRWRPDRVVLQWWTAFWTPAWLTLAFTCRMTRRCPIVYICHNVVPHGGGLLNRLAARLVLRLGSGFVVQSQQERECLLGLVPQARVALRLHPAHVTFTQWRVPREQARAQLGIPSGTPLLLFFGFVRPYKGLSDLLSALPAARQALPALRLVVAGEFWEGRGTYDAQIQSLGLEESVILHDSYIPNQSVGLHFSAADVLVAPYRSVTGSGVAQIARAFALPMITTRVGSMAELAQRNPGISLVEPGDVAALSDAIVDFFATVRPGAAVDAVAGEAECEWSDLARVVTSL